MKDATTRRPKYSVYLYGPAWEHEYETAHSLKEAKQRLRDFSDRLQAGPGSNATVSWYDERNEAYGVDYTDEVYSLHLTNRGVRVDRIKDLLGWYPRSQVPSFY